MTFKDMILASSDINKDGEIKTSFNLTLIRKNLSSKEETLLYEIPFRAVCNMYKGLAEFQCDLVFSDNEDEILNDICINLNRYRSPLNSLADETDYADFWNLVIVPDEYNGEYYIVGLGVFAVNLTAYMPDSFPNVLRFSFLTDDVFLVEDNEDSQEDIITETINEEEVDEIFLENPVPKKEEEPTIIEEDIDF